MNRKGRLPYGRRLQFVEKVFFEYFLGAAHASLSVAKLWSASEVRKVSAWEGALPLPFPRFFEKNRVKLFILHTFLCHFNTSADSYVSIKMEDAERPTAILHFLFFNLHYSLKKCPAAIQKKRQPGFLILSGEGFPPFPDPDTETGKTR